MRVPLAPSSSAVFACFLLTELVISPGRPPACAQTTGDMKGFVVDGGGIPLPGVSIEVRSPALQAFRTATTGASGEFRLAVLPPGVYVVSARLPGFKNASQPEVRVALGETVHVRMTLVLAAKAEIFVSGDAPLVDTASAKTGVSMPAFTLAKLPLGRNFSSAMLTLGGSGKDSAGNTVYGATGLENSYIIEGLNTTGVVNGNQGKQLNLEFIQEVEVRTGGYEAEYGRAMGASVNVVTKSGGNEFHGDFFGYFDSSSLAASDQHVDDRAALNLTLPDSPKRYDFGLDLGGYFLRDVLWFFGAYDRVRNDASYQRVDSLTYTPTSVVSNYVDGTDVTRTDIFSAKLTLRAGPSHTFVVSVFGDPGKTDGRLYTSAGPASAVLGSYEIGGGTDVAARWEGVFGSRVLAQAQYGYHEEGWTAYSDYADWVRFAEIRRGFSQAMPGSGPGGLGPGTMRRNAWGASATAFIGSHEIKAGIGYEYLNSYWSDYYSGGGVVRRWLASKTGAFLYAGHSGWAKYPLNCQVRTDGTRGNFGWVDPTTCNSWEPTARADTYPRMRNLGLFIQDSWKIRPNLTLNFGVRYEDQRIYDAQDQPRITLTDQWSPRVGVVWDPLKNGRSKVYASYGRYYQVIPQYIQIAAMGNEYGIFAYNYTANHLDLVNDSNLAPFEYLVGSDYVPPGVKGIYQDEVTAGVEVEVWKNWSFGIKGIYRSLGRVLEDRCDVYDPRTGLAGSVPPEAATACAMMNPGVGQFGQLSDPANPDCWEDFPASTVPKPCEPVHASRVFRGLQLDVRRRFSEGFQLQASYLYSRLVGNYDGFVNQRTGQGMPSLNGDFDTPDTLVNVWGKLSLDRTHQIKLSGLYVLPFGLLTGINASFATGAPLSIMGRTGSYLIYLEPRGSWDQLPSTYNVDLHLEYPIRVASVTLTPLVDIFNVTNAQIATQRGQTYNNVIGGNQTPPYTAPTVPPFGQNTAWQSPRLVRVGARVTF